jgi:hypothetical protein
MMGGGKVMMSPKGMSAGEKRFARLEAMIWGIYVILIGSSIIPQLIN